MDVALISTIITALSAVLVAVVSGIFTRYAKKQDESYKRINERAALRSKETKLLMDMIRANNQLSVGIAWALKRGHCNGEVEDGLKKVKEAEDNYLEFVSQIARDDITGVRRE